MNAIPPKGQMPRTPQDGVRLTMDFDDDLPEAEIVHPPHPVEAEDWGATEGVGQAAEPDPRQQDAASPQVDSPRRAPRQASAQGPAVPPSLAGIEVQLSVEVGALHLPLRDLLSVEPGQLLALDRMTNDPVTVLVNGKPFARGEIVAIGERFGVRLLEIISTTHMEGPR